MRAHFRMSTLPHVVRTDRIVAENVAVPNAVDAFGAMNAVGDTMAVGDGDVFPVYAYTGTEVRGANSPENYFRGIQRLRTGPYVALSGGFGTGRRRSHVFVVKLGTRAARGPWGSNLVNKSVPTAPDRVISCYGIDTFRWRAGGLSRLGDILAVPIEGKRKSRVVFLHTRNPDALERFQVEIDRPSIPSAEAAAIERLPDGRFIVGVWRELKGNYPGRLDIYVSNTDDFTKGFRPGRLSWTFNGLDGESERMPRYRNINFIIERRAAGQTQLYMIGTENTSAAAPVENGANLADLWRVRLPAALLSGGVRGNKPRLEHLMTREFHAVRDHANFGAAAGVYIGDGGTLHLYSGFHWRVEHTIRMAEYASHNPGTIQDLQDAWIELYEHDDFRGKRLTVYGKRHAEIPDYSRIFVDNGDFDDRVSSARFQIPRGYAYRLYRDANYKESKRWGKAFVDLVGTGTPVAVPDLKDRPYRFGDRISSSKFVANKRQVRS